LPPLILSILTIKGFAKLGTGDFAPIAIALGLAGIHYNVADCPKLCSAKNKQAKQAKKSRSDFSKSDQIIWLHDLIS